MYFENKNNNNNGDNDDDDDAKSSKSMYRVNASAVANTGADSQRQRAFWGGSRGDLAITASDDDDEGVSGGRNDDGRRSTTPTRNLDRGGINGSTPQLDTSVVSGHCVSMENVDKVGRREKFMQQTFDFHPGNT